MNLIKETWHKGTERTLREELNSKIIPNVATLQFIRIHFCNVDIYQDFFLNAHTHRMRNGKTIEHCDICPEALSKHGPLMGIVWLIKYNFQSEFGYLSSLVSCPTTK